MKILQIINNLGSGGAEKLLECAIPLMNKNDRIVVDVLLLTDINNVFYDSLISNGIKVDTIKYNNLYDLRNIIEIRNYIKYGDYDIVHSHTFPTQYWVALSKLFFISSKVKFITTEHNTYNRRRDRYYFRYIDSFVYSLYDKIISISRQTEINLINWIYFFKKDIDKHIVIENGIDINNIVNSDPYTKTELIRATNCQIKLVCMVGRFSEQKNQSLLIESMTKLSKDINLVLVGEGPLLEANKQLAMDLGVSDRVHFLGFRNDISRILKTVDIVALSSHWEGFGLAAVEGMAAHKPVIASDVEGLREIVEDFGFIFKDKNELIKYIELLFKDETLYRKVSNRCYNRAQNYNIDKYLESLLCLYDEQMNNR